VKALCGQNVEFLSVKPGGTGLSRVNSLGEDNVSKTEQNGMAAALYNGVMKVRGSELGRNSDRIFVSLVVPANRCQDTAAPDWGDDRFTSKSSPIRHSPIH
jgi:hypothetical protein